MAASHFPFNLMRSLTMVHTGTEFLLRYSRILVIIVISSTLCFITAFGGVTDDYMYNTNKTNYTFFPPDWGLLRRSRCVLS